MDLLTQTDLQKMTREHTDFCVSIFMPAAGVADRTIENPIRFKDLIDNVENRLRQAKLSNRLIEKYLTNVKDLPEDDSFWRDNFESLAVFLHKNDAVTLKLPTNIQEEITVSHYCNILPVLGYFTDNGTYYLLSISEGGCRLYKGDHYSFSDITPKEIKKPKKEVMSYLLVGEEEFYKVKKHGGRDTKRESVIFFGHGNEKDDRKTRVLEYLGSIEKVISKQLYNEKSPLILAGSEFNTSVYRGVNNYRNTLTEVLAVEPGPPNQKELHEKSWELANTYFDDRLLEMKQKYCDGTGVGRSSSDPKEVIQAAKYGRVDTLFVDENSNLWGSLEDKNEAIDIVLTGNFEDENLNNLAAVFTFRSNGRVLVLDSDKMPERVPFCALLRY